jgi:hypothetical protein
MNIKEALFREKLNESTYREIIVADKLCPDRFIWTRLRDEYQVEDAYSKHYGEFEDYYDHAKEKVDLREVDWSRCCHFGISLDLKDIVSLFEKVKNPITIQYLDEKWYVYSGQIQGSAKSLRDALLLYLFDYVCSQDPTIFKVE